MNTYQVKFFPEGWSTSVTPLGYMETVVAQEFVIDADYIVFVDDQQPQKAVFVIPHAACPVVTRTAVSA